MRYPDHPNPTGRPITTPLNGTVREVVGACVPCLYESLWFRIFHVAIALPKDSVFQQSGCLSQPTLHCLFVDFATTDGYVGFFLHGDLGLPHFDGDGVFR